MNHRDATALGEHPYNGYDFVSTCSCGREFTGPTSDDADAVLIEHIDEATH